MWKVLLKTLNNILPNNIGGIYSAGEADVSYANFAKQYSPVDPDAFWDK